MNENGEINFPLKRKREPKLVVFQEPCQQKRNNIRKKRSTDVGTSQIDDDSFIDIAREVKEFGISGFTRKEQKKDKQKYAEHLGARKQKQQKVPYPMLIDRAKKRKIKEGKQKELERSMGIFKKKKKEEDVKFTQKMNLGRWVDKSGLAIKGGRDNSIKINKKEIFKVKNTKTR